LRVPVQIVTNTVGSMFAESRLHPSTRVSAYAIAAMNPRRTRAPVMANKHFIRVGCAMALFIVDSGSRAQLPLLILIIVGIDQKSYMDPRNAALSPGSRH